jgi:hypothetical protein
MGVELTVQAHRCRKGEHGFPQIEIPQKRPHTGGGTNRR